MPKTFLELSTLTPAKIEAMNRDELSTLVTDMRSSREFMDAMVSGKIYDERRRLGGIYGAAQSELARRNEKPVRQYTPEQQRDARSQIKFLSADEKFMADLTGQSNNPAAKDLALQEWSLLHTIGYADGPDVLHGGDAAAIAELNRLNGDPGKHTPVDKKFLATLHDQFRTQSDDVEHRAAVTRWETLNRLAHGTAPVED